MWDDYQSECKADNGALMSLNVTKRKSLWSKDIRTYAVSLINKSCYTS